MAAGRFELPGGKPFVDFSRADRFHRPTGKEPADVGAGVMVLVIFLLLLALSVWANHRTEPHDRAQARAALDAQGYPGAELRPNRIGYCGRGEVSYRWRTTAVTGTICVGFRGTRVTVFNPPSNDTYWRPLPAHR